MANRLAHETSPYLRQHADNPVDWYPWGSEAFDRARREDKPVLLSVGYAACHWCHVMAHESFEDPATAALMNERFVNIKVDREERPDVDGIYMQAVQAMTGHGGWPMTMFLTPKGEPFFGGTYYPPSDRHGMPGFPRVLRSIADAYHTRRDGVDSTASKLRELYEAVSARAVATGELTPAMLERAFHNLAHRIDISNGGFEGAPKFPMAMALDFLLRYWRRTETPAALDAVVRSFRHMAHGGIYDQLGGGFHRYAVDAIWLVPHFEKMLYDNALLGRLGVHLWQATGDPEVRRITSQTLDWVIREMTDPNGGFYSSLDADSSNADGVLEEGAFYVWSSKDIEDPVVREYYGVTEGGNFEGHNILHVARDRATGERTTGGHAAGGHTTGGHTTGGHTTGGHAAGGHTTGGHAAGGHAAGGHAAGGHAAGDGLEPPAITAARPTLLARRAKRERPARDEKILAAWNGLMLSAMADAASAFGNEAYKKAALTNGEFLANTLVKADGRVMRSHAFGVTKIDGFLDDHAAVALGFVSLYELTFDTKWLTRAQQIAAAIDRQFWDAEKQAFFDTAVDGETLIVRPRDITDNAVPSGTSLTVDLYLHLAELTNSKEQRARAEWVLSTLAEPMTLHAAAFGYLLGAADTAVHGATQVALIGDLDTPEFHAMAAAVATTYIPSLVMAGGPPTHASTIALLDDRPAINDQPTAYVCRGYVCDRPTTDASLLAADLLTAHARP